MGSDEGEACPWAGCSEGQRGEKVKPLEGGPWDHGPCYPPLPVFVRRHPEMAVTALLTCAVEVFAELFWPMPGPWVGVWLHFPIWIFWKSHFQTLFLVLTGLQSLLSQALRKAWHVDEVRVLRGPRECLLGSPGFFPEDLEKLARVLFPELVLKAGRGRGSCLAQGTTFWGKKTTLLSQSLTALGVRV